MRRLLFTLALILPVLLKAQNITLNGKVTNSKNEPISGASVVVKPINRTLVTDVEGRFSVSLEPGKKFQLEVSAISYSPKMITDIEVGKDIDNNINIVLEQVVKELEGVVVRATSRKQESTMAMLSFQRNNSALSSVMAADFIRQTPDKNTGEVLKRVSGASIQDNKYVIVRGLSDRYNQALLNDSPMPSSEPDKKAFSFDMIPATMIDNIIINKTATPDLPGEFAGGLVQVNTKDIPSKSQLSVGFSLGYNTQSTFKDFTSNKRNSLDWLGFDDGSRSLPDGLPGVSDYRSQTDEQKIETTRTFKDDVYSEVQKKALPITTLNVSYAGKKQFKNGGTFGTIVGLYYRHAETIYDEVERGRYEQVRTPIFEGTEVQNRFSSNLGVIANFTYVKGKNKISFKNLFNQLYEDNYYNRLLNNTGRLQEVSLRSSFLNQRALYSGQLEGEHSLTKSGVRLKWNGNFSHNYKTQPDFRTAQYVRSFSTPNGDFELDDDDTRRFYSTLKDYNAGANGALIVPFALKGEKQTLKFGGGTLVRFRDFNARIFRYEPASPATDLAIPYDQAFLKSNINSNGLFLDEQTQNTDKYFGVSVLDNAYAMFDNKFGKFRVIWGLRAEYFEQFLESTDLSLKQITINTEKWDFLPSVNMTYALNTKNQIRVAASKTVSRPEFREIAPFQFFDYEQIWGISGEPTLQRTSIINADLRYEYYPKSGEVISIGLIAKKFDKPIEIRMDPGSNGDRWLFNYSNAEEATLYGAEFEIRKGLDFISEKLSKLVFIGNATLLDSKVTLVTESNNNVKTQQDRPLFGQSPYLINAGFQYGNKSWNMSALYNRIGPRLALVGDPTGAGFYDIYEKPRNLVDLMVSKKLWENKAELKLTVSDLLNNKYAFYDNPSAKAGFDYNGGDRINYAYKPGTTITVGFTYNFDLK
ncbi:MAG TPA: outer membrane beta-barrel protein [Chitinophagaceae bacterium]|nr:outer membrane beta-barrel protein [Chitinophagaceae bacterium]